MSGARQTALLLLLLLHIILVMPMYFLRNFSGQALFCIAWLHLTSLDWLIQLPWLRLLNVSYHVCICDKLISTVRVYSNFKSRWQNNLQRDPDGVNLLDYSILIFVLHPTNVILVSGGVYSTLSLPARQTASRHARAFGLKSLLLIIMWLLLISPNLRWNMKPSLYYSPDIIDIFKKSELKLKFGRYYKRKLDFGKVTSILIIYINMLVFHLCGIGLGRCGNGLKII